MKYRPKQDLAQKVAIAGLASYSLIAGGCILGDIATEGLGIAADRHGDPLTGDILRGAGRVVGKETQRSDNTRVKYEDANVDTYRSREESKIRIAEERALNEIYNQSGQDEETQEILRGRTIISAIQREFKKHPFDWERNADMIARAYREELTSGDKGKLQDILETMFYCTRGEVKILRAKVYGRHSDYLGTLMEFKRDFRRILGDTEGIISLYEFMINHPDTNLRLRGVVIDSYTKQIKIKSRDLSDENAIDLIRSKISLLEEVKDDVSLSSQESKSVLSSINKLERMLRPKLAKTDPEFREKEKEVLDTLKRVKTPKEAEKILESSTIELAKELGHSTRLRKATDKIAPELKTQLEQKLTEQELPNEEESSTGYWLIPLLAALGLGSGTSYKYRGFLYGKYKEAKDKLKTKK